MLVVHRGIRMRRFDGRSRLLEVGLSIPCTYLERDSLAVRSEMRKILADWIRAWRHARKQQSVLEVPVRKMIRERKAGDGAIYVP